MIEIGSYTLKPALGTISITSSAGTSSYRNGIGIDYQKVILITSLELSSSKVEIGGSYTQYIPHYVFKNVPVSYVSESVSNGLYTQFIGLDYPTVYQRAMLQDGVSIKLRSINAIYFYTRSMAVSDYIRY